MRTTMRSSIFKRSVVFATFFGSCLCIALLVGALGTTHWIDARARRTTNPNESDGRIQYGLFEGRKELNSGAGWRTYEYSAWSSSNVISHPARKWARYGAGALAAGSVLSAGGAAILAVLAAAAHKPNHAPLLITDSLSAILSAGAIAVWCTEYVLRLQYNVMSEHDLANSWTSDQLAELGLSFWLVVCACGVSILNLTCVCVAGFRNNAHRAPSLAPHDKHTAAIMLY